MKQNFKNRISATKKKLLKTPSLCFLPLIGNFLSGAYLMSMGDPIEDEALMNGVPVVILLVIYAGLRTGEIGVRSAKYSVQKNPRGFWQNVLIWFLFYLLLSIGMPIASIGRHANGFGWN
jgi:hypothetical protein